MPNGGPERRTDHPFYVEPDCCLLCGNPEHIAPELFRTGAEQCFLIRQPSTPAEIDRAVEAMRANEVDCIRYGGDDLALLRRLGHAGLARLADDARADRYPALRRDRVAFALPPERGPVRSSELAADFRSFLRRRGGLALHRTFLARRTVSFSWSGDAIHAATFQGDRTAAVRTAQLRVVRPVALQSAALILHEWLTGDSQATDIAWHTHDSLLAGDPGFPMPF